MSEQPGEDLQAAHGEEQLAAVWKGRDGWGGGWMLCIAGSRARVWLLTSSDCRESTWRFILSVNKHTSPVIC